jgi:hypothetical protein
MGINVALVPDAEKAGKWRYWVSKYPLKQAFVIYRKTYGHAPTKQEVAQ